MYNNRNFRQRHQREWMVVLKVNKQINKPDEKVSGISTDIISLDT